MKKMMLFTMMSLTLLAAMVNSAAAAKHNKGQVFENGSANKMQLFGSKTELDNSSDITQRDVELMWAKVQLGIQVVNQFWQLKFYQNGFYYRPPQVKYYTAPFYSGCGLIQMNNAEYCSADHTIYFDAIFFTQLMKNVGETVGSDGDMAIILVIAHEWGHAVQSLTGTLSNTSILNETNADCMAGAFTLYAYQQGLLEKGDLEEAVTAISSFGDNLPWDRPGAHGNSVVRLEMFKTGLKGGLPACGGGFNR